MPVNRKIIVAVVGITAISLVRAWTQQLAGSKTVMLTPIIMGAYIVLLVLSLVDMFGGAASGIVGGIALLALFTVVLTQFPWSIVFAALNPQKTKQGTGQ